MGMWKKADRNLNCVPSKDKKDIMLMLFSS